MHRSYFGQPGAQVHYREDGVGEALVLLPPAPHSGLYFATVMPCLAKNWHVIAPDYPGYGGSDLMTGTPTIQDYAISLVPLLEQFTSAHIVGFHTGNLVALEIALQRPDLISTLIMIDVPFFETDVRKDLKAKIGGAKPLPQTLDDLASGFETNIVSRKTDMGLSRAYDVWVESLRAGEAINSAFDAAFSYDCEAKFSQLSKEVDIIATQSGLLNPSRKAAEILLHARLIERLDIDKAVFELFAKDITDQINHILT